MDDLPPPPYAPTEPYPLPTLSTLPFNILSLIVSHLSTTLPRSPLDHATTLLWLTKEARLSSRMFYRVIQTHLRQLHLPSYRSHVRPPFSSDPIPSLGDTGSTIPFHLASFPASQYLSLAGRRHETAVLDQFISARARERCERLESEGFGEEWNWREDLFGLYQPQARLLDLLTVSLLEDPPPVPLLFEPSTLSLRFTLRKITLFLTSAGGDGVGGLRKRELLSKGRERGESEEISGRRMREGLGKVRLLESV